MRKVNLVSAILLVIGTFPAAGLATDPFGGQDTFDSDESIEVDNQMIATGLSTSGCGTDPTVLVGTITEICGPAPNYNAKASRPGRVELASYFGSFSGITHTGGFACREINNTGIQPNCDGDWYPSWSVCWSTHAAGRAIDVHVCQSQPGCPQNQNEPIVNQASGDALANWLLKQLNGEPAYNARRIGIMQILWHDRCWSPSRNVAHRTVTSVAQMAACGISNHDDHLHLTLTSAAADGRTPWIGGSVPPRGP